MEDTFGNRLRNIRITHGMTQLQFAHQLDSFPWLISRYERDKTKPNLKFIEKLVSVFQIDANELFKENSRE